MQEYLPPGLIHILCLLPPKTCARNQIEAFISQETYIYLLGERGSFTLQPQHFTLLMIPAATRNDKYSRKEGSSNSVGVFLLQGQFPLSHAN